MEEDYRDLALRDGAHDYVELETFAVALFQENRFLKSAFLEALLAWTDDRRKLQQYRDQNRQAESQIAYLLGVSDASAR